MISMLMFFLIVIIIVFYLQFFRYTLVARSIDHANMTTIALLRSHEIAWTFTTIL